MAHWEFKGRELVNCSCEYGCNCQFNALPDKGHCHAVAGIQIDEGHHGDTRLDGLRIAAIFTWPGPIHEGNGEAIAFVDRRADDRQREALPISATVYSKPSGSTICARDSRPVTLLRIGSPTVSM